MSSQTPSLSASLDKYLDEGILSTLLRYGLFVGAIFQLLCIISSILLPASKRATGDIGECIEEHKSSGLNGGDLPRRLQKLRKQEKKKRR